MVAAGIAAAQGAEVEPSGKGAAVAHAHVQSPRSAALEIGRLVTTLHRVLFRPPRALSLGPGRRGNGEGQSF